MNTFPHYHFSGAPRDRGLAYGEALRERIQSTYSLYADSLFSQSTCAPAALAQRAEQLRDVITAFAPDYTTELDAVAAGAGMERWQIYALNGRTEILNVPVNECTALYFEDSAILGQNWDWVAALEDLAVLVTWELPDGHRVLMLTEPGMLGKIGFNDRGLGVCLNILFSKHQLDGVPVHVLTRAVLDCGSVEEARTLLIRSGCGKSSHFLLGDRTGHCCSMEFAAGGRYEVALRDGVLVHTNHCLAADARSKAALIPTTVERYDQACDWLSRTPERDLDAMKQILLDDSKGDCSINLAYHPEALLDNQPVGTCATMLMDLGSNELHVKRGPGRTGAFTSVQL